MAECTGLENRRRETVRGFKSHPLRQIKSPRLMSAGFFIVASWPVSLIALRNAQAHMFWLSIPENFLIALMP